MTNCELCQKEKPEILEGLPEITEGDRCWGCAVETKTFQKWTITGAPEGLTWFISVINNDLNGKIQIDTR